MYGIEKYTNTLGHSFVSEVEHESYIKNSLLYTLDKKIRFLVWNALEKKK